MSSIPPRVLLVEDDPVSRTFLAAAVRGLPATVDAADSMAAALVLAAATAYDVWLLDANLPDGSGAELLARLRARDGRTPAIAHTATHDPDVAVALESAGFTRVLVKPLPAIAVQQALRSAMGLDAAQVATAASPEASSDWDDDAATRALNGNPEHIAALRRLFIAELPGVVERVRNAFRNEDFQGLHAELHRLRASCGFVGAARLLLAVQALGANSHSQEALHGFTVAARALTAADEPSPA